jgi:hypothetical protein
MTASGRFHRAYRLGLPFDVRFAAKATCRERTAARPYSIMTTLGEVRRVALACLRPPPKLALSDWIERKLVLPEGTSALPGKVRLWPYQRTIADAISVMAQGRPASFATCGAEDAEGQPRRTHRASQAAEVEGAPLLV